jgi:hypothetical protein
MALHAQEPGGEAAEDQPAEALLTSDAPKTAIELSRLIVPSTDHAAVRSTIAFENLRRHHFRQARIGLAMGEEHAVFLAKIWRIVKRQTNIKRNYSGTR